MNHANEELDRLVMILFQLGYKATVITSTFQSRPRYYVNISYPVKFWGITWGYQALGSLGCLSNGLYLKIDFRSAVQRGLQLARDLSECTQRRVRIHCVYIDPVIQDVEPY